MAQHRRTLSSSSLEGDPVVNTAGEDLGKIEDLMIDLKDGRVAYAVMSFGGFLGMGDKLFALPWEAINVNEEDKKIVLDVPKDRLKDAPGFDKDNWPDFADPAFRSSIHSYYGFESRAA